MIFDDHKDVCICCKHSIRQGQKASSNELVWCKESDGIEPWYYKCEKFISRFSHYNNIWKEVF